MAYKWTPPAPTQRTAFSEVLPYEKVFNPTLINQLALSQLQPEINRQQAQASGDLWRNLALSGAYRTGQAGARNQNLVDSYGRLLKEQTADFTGKVNDWATDWYNRQSENYYKNPSAYVMPTLPTFDQFMKSNPPVAGAYPPTTGTNANPPSWLKNKGVSSIEDRKKGGNIGGIGTPGIY